MIAPPSLIGVWSHDHPRMVGNGNAFDALAKHFRTDSIALFGVELFNPTEL